MGIYFLHPLFDPERFPRQPTRSLDWAHSRIHQLWCALSVFLFGFFILFWMIGATIPGQIFFTNPVLAVVYYLCFFLSIFMTLALIKKSVNSTSSSLFFVGGLFGLALCASFVLGISAGSYEGTFGAFITQLLSGILLSGLSTATLELVFKKHRLSLPKRILRNVLGFLAVLILFDAIAYYVTPNWPNVFFGGMSDLGILTFVWCVLSPIVMTCDLHVFERKVLPLADDSQKWQILTACFFLGPWSLLGALFLPFELATLFSSELSSEHL